MAKTQRSAKAMAPWRIMVRPGLAGPDGSFCRAQAAAALAEVGTDAIVFRIWEAIW